MKIRKLLALLLALALWAGTGALPASAAGELVYGIGFVTAGEGQLRAGPEESAEVLCPVRQGDCVVVLGTTGQWYRVSFNLRTGYLHRDSLSVRTKENAELGFGVVTESRVNLRSGPSCAYGVTAAAVKGQVCYILGLEDGWYRVLYGDRECFIRCDYLERKEIPYENEASSKTPRFYIGGKSTGTVPDAAAIGGDLVNFCAGRILNACVRDGELARTEVNRLLAQMEQADPEQTGRWRAILDNWAWIYRDTQVGGTELPEGLPEDDSLCILVFGFGLNADGSPKPELTDRLQVALGSAEKYPNAYILCTGGATAADETTTEAAVMADWLAAHGVAESRILREDQSRSTTENARFSCALLSAYPRIRHVALVSSDYHILRCTLMFTTASLWAETGDTPIDVVANAACHAEGQSDEGIYTQAWGIALITGADWQGF